MIAQELEVSLHMAFVEARQTLAAAAEIFRMTGDAADARAAADELAVIATGSPSEVLDAT